MGECKSNWGVMKLLAAAMGYDEPWLKQSNEEIIAEVLDATRAKNPRLTGITLARLQAEGTVPYYFAPGEDVPFADLKFPTPSGKVELYSESLARHGLDPLPLHVEPPEFAAGRGTRGHLVLMSGAAHHFVSGSFGNQPKLLRKEGPPFVEIHPDDAAARGIEDGDQVRLENSRGSCTLAAVVTTDVLPGVLVAPKGFWASLSPDGRNINWLTSDALADLGGQSTFHSNTARLSLVAKRATPPAVAAAAAD
jgi:anaerobic selenocysteine-containing dehydrogenase